MIIKKLAMDDERFVDIEFNNAINIIHGDTDVGKTLVFKMIEYIFGSQESLDKKAMKSSFPNATEIVCVVENEGEEYVFKRSLYSVNIDVYLGDEKIKSYTDMKSYGDFIFSLFGFNSDVQLITSETSLKSSTLTLREYTKFLFFAESRLTEERSFIEVLGPTTRTKYLNLFSYLISGISLNADKLSLKTAKEEVRPKKTGIIRYLKEYQTAHENGLKENDNQKDNAYSSAEEQRQKVDRLFQEKEQTRKTVLALESEIFKLESMLDFYNDQMNEQALASELLAYLDKYQMICEGCGKKYEKYIEVEASDVKSHDDLSMVISSKKTILENTYSALARLNEQYDEAIEKLQEKEKEISILNKDFGYESISKMIEVLDEDLSTDNIEIDEIESNKQITNKIDEISLMIKNELIKTGLYVNPDVYFDYHYKVLDFVVDKKKRFIIGKGLRTLITTLLLLKMCEISKKEVGFIGFIMIDSLWTTLHFKEKDKKDRAISKIIAYMKQTGMQIILIDNEIPSHLVKDTEIKKINVK